MNDYSTVNILDMIDAIGEDALVEILSDFSCPKNQEIESFVRNKAIDFAKRKISITYLVIDNDSGEILSIFALTHKALEISRDALSSTSKKKLSRFAQLDENSGSYTVSAFLIAQFGKNYAVPQPEGWNGIRLMEKNLKRWKEYRGKSAAESYIWNVKNMNSFCGFIRMNRIVFIRSVNDIPKRSIPNIYNY